MDGYAKDNKLVGYNEDFVSKSTNSPGKSEYDSSDNKTKNVHNRSLKLKAGHKYKKQKLQRKNSSTKFAPVKPVVCAHCNQFFPNEESVCEHLFEIIKKFDSCTEGKPSLTKNVKEYNVNVKEKRNPVKIPVVILEKCDGLKERKYYYTCVLCVKDLFTVQALREHFINVHVYISFTTPIFKKVYINGYGNNSGILKLQNKSDSPKPSNESRHIKTNVSLLDIIDEADNKNNMNSDPICKIAPSSIPDDANDKPTLYLCNICNCYFVSVENVKRHSIKCIFTQYRVNERRKCKECSLDFYPTELYSHIQQHHTSKMYKNFNMVITVLSCNSNKKLQEKVNKDSVPMEPNLKHLITTQLNPKLISSSIFSFSPFKSQKTTLNTQLEDYISTPLQKTTLNTQLEDYISRPLVKTTLNSQLEDHISTPLQKTTLNALLDDHHSTPLQKTTLNTQLEDYISTPLVKTILNSQLEDHISTPLQKTTLNAQLEDHISTPLQKSSWNAQLEDHISTPLQKTTLNSQLEDHIFTPLQKTTLNSQLEHHISTPLQKTTLNTQLEDHIFTPLQKTTLNSQLEDHISTPLQKTTLNAQLEDHIFTPLQKTTLNSQLEDHISAPLQKTTLNSQQEDHIKSSISMRRPIRTHGENFDFNETSMTTQDNTFDTTEIDTISQISNNNSSRYDQKTMFVCHICNASFNTMSTHKYHMQCHEINKNNMKINSLPLGSDMCDQSSQHRRTPGPRVPRWGATATYRRGDDEPPQYNKESYLSKYKPYGKYLYKCTVCSIHFMKPQSLQNHVASGHNRINTGFGCDICKLLFESRNHILKHKWFHHDVHNYSKKDFIIINSYSNTQATKHKHIKIDPYVFQRRIVRGPKKNLYVCRTCEICFVTPVALKSHLLKDDHDIPRVMCRICGYAFDISSLNDHIKTHHKILKMQRENFVIKYSVPSRSDRQHLQNDSKHNKGANDKNSANANKTMHLYKCKHCNVFYVKMKTDENPNKERCNNCKRILKVKVIPNNTELESGKLTKLPMEDLSKNRTTPLSDDFLTSTDCDDDNCIEEDCSEIKLYKCAECDVHFLNKNPCLSHIRNHVPFSYTDYMDCKECGLKFNYRSLEIHRKSQHGKAYTEENVSIFEYKPGVGFVRFYCLKDRNEINPLTQELGRENELTNLANNTNKLNDDQIRRSDILESNIDKDDQGVLGETLENNFVNGKTSSQVDSINHTSEEVAENINNSNENISESVMQIFSPSPKKSKPPLLKCIKCRKYILTALKETSKDINVECNKCKVTSETTENVPYVNEVGTNDDSAIDKTIHSVRMISNNVDIVPSNDQIVVFKESNVKAQSSMESNATINTVVKDSNLAEQTNSDLSTCTKNNNQISNHSEKPENIALENYIDDTLNKCISSTETAESTSSIVVKKERIPQNVNLNSETEHNAIANDSIKTEPANFELKTVSEQVYSSKVNQDNIEIHNKPIINENDVYIVLSDDDFDVDKSQNVIEIDSDCEIEYIVTKEIHEDKQGILKETPHMASNIANASKDVEIKSEKHYNRKQNIINEQSEPKSHIDIRNIYSEEDIKIETKVENSDSVDNKYQVRNSDNGTFIIKVRVEVEQEDSWDSNSVKSEKMP